MKTTNKIPRLAENDCVVIDVRSIRTLSGEWAAGADIWYFGANYSDFLDLERQIPQSAVLASVGEEINAIAAAIKDEFINIDAQIAGRETAELDILSSDLVERNPYVGSLFLLSCRYIAFLNAMKRGGRHVFVCDDPQFARLLHREAKRLGFNVGWEATGRSRPFRDVVQEKAECMKSVVRGLRARLGGVRTLLRHKACTQRLRKSAPIPLAALRDVDVLVVTWARKDTFSQSQATDTVISLGRLPQIVRDEAGQTVGFVSVPLKWVDTFSDMAANGAHALDPVLLFEDVLTYRDILSAGWHSLFAVGRLANNLTVQGNDLSALLRMEKEREWVSWRPASVALFAKLGAYLRRQDITPQAIVYLYEHQSWEKCLLHGMRTHLPKVRMIACQQSAFSAQHQNLYPSKRDIANDVIPDVLLVSGERFAARMKRVLTNKTKIFNIGAIRYEDFFNLSRPASIALRRQNEDFSVLCATNSDVLDCCELVAKVATAAHAVGVKVVVNFHPLTDNIFHKIVKDCVATCCRTLDHVEFLTTPAGQLMNDVDAVFYSDTNAAFEAMFKELPIVHVKRVSALDYNQVPEEYCTVVRHSEEIQAYLIKLQNNEAQKNLAEEMKAGLLASLGPIDRCAIVKAVKEI